MPNVLVWAWYFWKKDVEGNYYMKDPDYYLRQQFQKFIYRLNQPFLRKVLRLYRVTDKANLVNC